MIPARAVKLIRDTFDEYGSDVEMVMDERLPDNSFFVVDDGVSTPAVHGSVRYINWARNVRDNVYVPECYDEAASTWA